MAKKSRIGTDPLSWIKDSRDESKQRIQNKQGLQDKPSLQIKNKRGRPKTSTRVITKSSQEGLTEGWIRATFIMRENYLEKIKDLAYWQRRQIKEVIDDILGKSLKGKKIKSREAK